MNIQFFSLELIKRKKSVFGTHSGVISRERTLSLLSAAKKKILRFGKKSRFVRQLMFSPAGAAFLAVGSF